MPFRAALIAACLLAGVAATAIPQSTRGPARTREAPQSDPMAPAFVGAFVVVPGGLRPGLEHDNAPSIQRAHDELVARFAAAGPPGFNGRIVIPGAPKPYGIRQPIWLDSGGIEVRGEPGAVLQAVKFSGPVLLMGLSRAGRDGSARMTHEYRPDLYGILDAKAAPAPGRRWGFRTHSDGYILGQGGHFTHVGQAPGVGGLDCWRSAQKLTIDFAYRVFAQSGWFCVGGMGVSDSAQGCPWMVQVDPDGQVQLFVGTQSAPYAAPKFYYSQFNVPNGRAGLHRVAIQVDLAVGSVMAWADRGQVAVGRDKSYAPGSHFFENQFEPFAVNLHLTPIPDFKPSGTDFALYGFSVSKGLRYHDAPNLTRADGKPINDGNTYFPDQFHKEDPDPVGHFAFTEDPAGDYTSGAGNGRVLTVVKDNTNAAENSQVILGRMGQGTGGTGGHAVRDLKVIGGSYGPAIGLASVLGATIERVSVRGGAYGIGNLPYGANYPVMIRDCDIDNHQDSSIWLSMAIATLDNVRFQNSGRSTLRLQGSNVDGAHLKVGAWNPSTQSTFRIHGGAYGGVYTFRDVNVDFEGPGYGQAFCVADRTAYATQGSLKFEDLNLGTIGNVPLFLLKNTMTQSTWPGRLMVDNLQTYAAPACWIESDSPHWSGTITNSRLGGAPPATPIRYSGPAGTAHSLKIQGIGPDEPPPAGK